MAFAVVLDACVLYPLPLRDTLLRCAEQDLYEVRWSRRILDEVVRNLVEDDRATPEQAAKLINAMQHAFEDAEIPAPAIVSLESRMTNDSADRHVLAAAVASNDAKTIVTSNPRHFPAAACQPFGRGDGLGPRRPGYPPRNSPARPARRGQLVPQSCLRYRASSSAVIKPDHGRLMRVPPGLQPGQPSRCTGGPGTGRHCQPRARDRA